TSDRFNPGGSSGHSQTARHPRTYARATPPTGGLTLFFLKGLGGQELEFESYFSTYGLTIVIKFVNSSIFLISMAGTLPTTLFAVTSSETTAPDATTEFSPTVTPGRIVAFAPIQAFRLITTASGTNVLRSAVSTG